MRVFVLVALVFSGAVNGQTLSPEATAFPCLRIPGSSRGLAMGDGGIASAVENQSLFYNTSKSAFTQHFHQVSVMYTPWMAAISDDCRFINLNYLRNVFNTSAIGVALSYLNYGSLETRDNNGATLSRYTAREFALGSSYALQVSEQASLGVTLKLLGSNVFTDEPRNILSMCGDVSYYQFADKFEWGVSVSNLGPKVGFADKVPLPLNFGAGVAYTMSDEEMGNQFVFSLDANKLSDVRISAGIEYGYLNEFFLRGGVSLENQLKGNRKYFGFGVGYKGLVFDQSWGIDFHYLVPFGTVAAVSPFQNALGFTLKVNFGNFQ